MKKFQCNNCDHSLFFEDTECSKCGKLIGYWNRERSMLTYNPIGGALICNENHVEYKYCKNKVHGVCNWVIETSDPNEYCEACQLNRTIPDLSEKKNFENWRHLEVAKHRLIYQLIKIGLPIPSKITNEEEGLCFDFVAGKGNPELMTGHANGVITILLKEADSVLREQMRKDLFEPYRTLIGHLRHEVGHYFWDRLVFTNPDVLNTFRDIFGDERQNYSEALKKHYRDGPRQDWEKEFISKYAASHPWEDWAESWAHYLHIISMVESAYFFGIQVDPKTINGEMKVDVSFDPYTVEDFDQIIQTCVPLSFAVNSINRAMGVPDLYPFVLTAHVIEKMKFIHRLLLNQRDLKETAAKIC